MKHNNKTAHVSDLPRSNTDNSSRKWLSEFIVGLITFIAFVVFMTTWMYFRSKN